MKETIKVSIGGYAFTLDKDAYDELNRYLSNIKFHFETKVDGEEIVSDIEYRMCELLQMKLSKTDYIITLADATNIIKIMGDPIDFDSEEAIADKKTSNEADNTIKKKLYRDTDNSILGGVCSGLAQYFHLDPVIIRVGLVASIIIGEAFDSRISGLLILAYILLWIVTPAAKTIIQKISMSGKNPTVENIQAGTTKIKRRKNKQVGSPLLKIIKIISSILLCLIGLFLLIVTIIAFYFTSILNIPTMMDIVEVLGINLFNFNLSLILVLVLPTISLVYLGIKLITKITSKDIIIIGITVVLWIVAVLYITKITLLEVIEYKYGESASEIIAVNKDVDTLYIDIAQTHKDGEVFPPNTPLYRLDQKPQSWFILPLIDIRKDSIYNEMEIEIEKIAFDKKNSIAQQKAIESVLSYTLNDSLLTISPEIYNKDNIWNREFFKIIIHCPLNKEVVIEETAHKSMEGENIGLLLLELVSEIKEKNND